MKRFFVVLFVLVTLSAVLRAQNPEPYGWYAGDMHVHRSCGSSPEPVSSVYDRMNSQNLSTLSLLADMGNGEVQDPATDLPLVNGQDASVSTAGRIVHWDAEWHWDATYAQYPHQALGGHIVALGLKEAHQVWQEYTYPIFDWAHQQNAVAGFAHMQYLGSGFPTSLTCCTPVEYPVEVALASADFISEDVNGGDAAIEAYYRLLNSGFRPGLAAGTDYPCNPDKTVGSPLTYVRVPGSGMTYRNWIDGISSGRTVVSLGGHNEFLDLKVNGSAGPGDQIDLTGGAEVSVTVQWTATQSLTGTVELVWNGAVVASQQASVSNGGPITLSTTVPFAQSGWLAARRTDSDGQHVVHTAAVFVIVNSQPVRVSATDPQFYVDWMSSLVSNTSSGGSWNGFFPTSLSAAQTRYSAAKALYQQIASEAAGVQGTPTLSSITVTPGGQNLSSGTAQPFTATGHYSNGGTLNLTGQVTWASADTGIAAVNLRGLVVAGAAGSTVISARLGNISGSDSVNVVAPLSITVAPLNPAILVGSTQQFTATATYADSGTQDVTAQAAWASSNPTVAGITASGLATGLATGASTISATVGATSGGTTLTVAAPSADCPPSTPCSIFGDTGTPQNADENDHVGGIEVGVRFRSDVDGFIAGLRFFKGASNTGTHEGHLWDNSGNLVATAVFTGESASGWQQVLFSSPVPISANTTYVASYFSPNGGYAVTTSYFTHDVYRVPLHFLADGVDGGNGPYLEPTSAPAFPTQTYQSSNYWVDVLFTSDGEPDIDPPTLTLANPVNGAIDVPVTSRITARFSEMMNASTVTGATFVLRDPTQAPVLATVTYNAATLTATLVPTTALATSTLYTATVSGGTTGVQDASGNAMVADVSWRFSTAAPPPTEGPGGPILVISSSANPFSRYFVEILRAEGLNEFTAMDIAQVSADTLAAYDVVILGELPLSSDQTAMLSSWVSAGGNLIAMRPDKKLASVLGLTDIAGVLANGYLAIDTGTSPGAGLVGQTIQFHGSADLYSLNGATVLATLYSNAATATSSPAVALANFGAGQAATFTYDLARSVVYTRQGNPAWSGMERDGVSPIRSDDLFYGASASDPQADWIDLNKVSIPQADEQQRLLANLILQMNLHNKPLPRFWYLPRSLKAAVVMTGDDHGSAGTLVRFNTFLADSPQGCSVDNWECVRGTSYLTGSEFGDTQAATFLSQGFELALHVSTGCSDFTPQSLESNYESQLADFHVNFPSLPSPQTNRTHCIAWSDYDTQPQVELNHGIRFDTNYYYWPGGNQGPNWLQDRPGMFTGSGMPMRFAKMDGTLIDVYQATTQMTDESGQSYPYNIDTLLDNAIGATGYYGVFTANMHTDSGDSAGANAIVASAQARDIPVVTAMQMLQWLDGRNASSFGNLSWNGNTMSFTISMGNNTTGAQAMLPELSSAGMLSSLTLDGGPVSYTVQTTKGIAYAVFSAATGSYIATYAADTTPPVISSLAAAPDSSSTATITWTTDKLSTSVVNYGTSSGSLGSQATAPGLVTEHSVSLSGLAPNTTYFYQVTSADALDNTATAPSSPATFQTPAAALSDSSTADFASGSGSCSAVTLTTGGEVILTPAVDAEFTGSSLPAGWSSNIWPGGGGVSVGAGAVTVDGADIASDQSYGPGHSIEFVATFSGQSFQHVGLAANLLFDSPWIMFSTGPSGGALYARIEGNSDVLLPGNWLGTPHHFRIDWAATTVVFSIDGAVVSTQNVAVPNSLVLVASDFNPGGGGLSVNWMRVSPYASACSFASRVFDAGAPVFWSTMSWTADTPVGTTLAMSYSIGDTPAPDGSWTSFTPVPSSGAAIAGNSRYIQYSAALATVDTTSTPALQSVSIAYGTSNGQPPVITAQSPTPGATNVPIGTSVSATFSNPMNAATITTSTFRLRAQGADSDVPATVSYAAGVATLLPNGSLTAATQYTATVVGTVADLNGNTLGADVTWNFTTGVVTLTHTDTTVTDFTAGSQDACSIVAHGGDGELTLAPAVGAEFSGVSLPAGWSSSPFTGGTAVVSNGVVSVDGALAAYDTFVGPGRSVEFVATFGADPFQHVGFGQQLNLLSESWAMFGTFNTNNTLYARTDNAGTVSDTPIPGNWIGTPHRYRIDWTATSLIFSIDGTVVHTEPVAIAATMRPVVSDYNNNGTVVTVDWLLMTPYSSSCTFDSAVFDAGAAANWSTLSWDATTPTNTALALSYRTGDTSNPSDGNWTSFAPVAQSGGALMGASQYIQYRASLGTTNVSQAPVLQDVTVSYSMTQSLAPAITTQPASQTIGYGQTAFLTVSAIGTDPLSYQWYQGTSGDTSNPVSGATANSFTTPLLTASTSYWIRVTNLAGSADSNTAVITITQVPQEITFGALGDKTVGDAPFAVSATASSGLAVSFTVGGSDSCTVAGDMVTITGAGNCTVTAHQAGDSTYSAAPDVAQSFTIAKATASIQLGNLSHSYDGTAKAAAATTTPSGLAVDLTYEGSATEPSAAGSYAVEAVIQDNNYQGSATGTLVIARALAAVTPNAAGKVYGTSDPALSGTLSGFLAADNVTATYSRTAGETVAGSPYTISATLSPAGVLGNYTISYNTAMFSISPADPLIVWGTPADIVEGTALSEVQLNASSPVAGTFSYNPGAGTVLGVGSHPLTATLHSTDTNYVDGKTATVTINVLPGLARIVAPANGTTLAGSTVTFSWTQQSGATSYQLWLGRSAGTHDLGVIGTTQLSGTVTTLPTDGSQIYVTLYGYAGGKWTVQDTASYTAATIIRAQILSPAKGSTLTGSTVTFNWTQQSGATSYQLWLGRSAGAHDLAVIGTTQLSGTVTTLPTDGSQIYATLYGYAGGKWTVQDTASYTALNLVKAAIQSPAEGATLAGSTVTFSWTAETGATSYQLWLGRTAGGHDLAVVGTAQLSATAAGLPIDGSPVYATLNGYAGGKWTVQDSKSYTAASFNKATIISPEKGSMLTGNKVTFSWTAETGATSYQLWLGHSAGAHDIAVVGTTQLSGTATTLPTDGSTVYVTLYGYKAGGWAVQDTATYVAFH